jgi:prepilin-type N-terminal cleavage/methylation domain-containing protein
VPVWRARSGFTLLELMVVCAVIVIVTTMAFSGFRYMTAVMNKAISVTKARENLTVVMDQLTKELREVSTVDDHLATGVTNDGGRLTYGVTLPAVPTTVDVPRSIVNVLSATSKQPGALLSGETYTFLTNVDGDGTTTPNGIMLEFFTVDTSGTPAKHRIRYSLTAPKVGSTYAGIGQQFWGTSTTEPCNITYCNNTWTGSSWTTESPQPMTDQVVTGFTVTRPAWSSNVVQITLEAQVRGLSGTTGYSTVRLIGLVTVRQ